MQNVFFFLLDKKKKKDKLTQTCGDSEKLKYFPSLRLELSIPCMTGFEYFFFFLNMPF